MEKPIFIGENEILKNRFPQFVVNYSLSKSKVDQYKKLLSLLFSFLKDKYGIEPIIPAVNNEEIILCKYFVKNYYCYTAKDYQDNDLLMVITIKENTDLQIFYDDRNQFNLKKNVKYNFPDYHLIFSNVAEFIEKVFNQKHK